jgi:hypothetical protein
MPYTLEQNGVAEWKNGSLVESTWSMLNHAKLSNGFWGEVIHLQRLIQKNKIHINITR